MFRGAAGGPKPSRTELDSEMNAANTLKSPRKARNTRASVAPGNAGHGFQSQLPQKNDCYGHNSVSIVQF